MSDDRKCEGAVRGAWPLREAAVGSAAVAYGFCKVVCVHMDTKGLVGKLIEVDSWIP